MNLFVGNSSFQICFPEENDCCNTSIEGQGRQHEVKDCAIIESVQQVQEIDLMFQAELMKMTQAAETPSGQTTSPLFPLLKHGGLENKNVTYDANLHQYRVCDNIISLSVSQIVALSCPKSSALEAKHSLAGSQEKGIMRHRLYFDFIVHGHVPCVAFDQASQNTFVFIKNHWTGRGLQAAETAEAMLVPDEPLSFAGSPDICLCAGCDMCRSDASTQMIDVVDFKSCCIPSGKGALQNWISGLFAGPPPDNTFVRHCLQLNLYSFLKRAAGFIVSNMFVLYACPNESQARLIEMPRYALFMF
jgi:hypothetical protein